MHDTSFFQGQHLLPDPLSIPASFPETSTLIFHHISFSKPAQQVLFRLQLEFLMIILFRKYIINTEILSASELRNRSTNSTISVQIFVTEMSIIGKKLDITCNVKKVQL